MIDGSRFGNGFRAGETFGAGQSYEVGRSFTVGKDGIVREHRPRSILLTRDSIERIAEWLSLCGATVNWCRDMCWLSYRYPGGEWNTPGKGTRITFPEDKDGNGSVPRGHVDCQGLLKALKLKASMPAKED
jgi:hypothetical protein